MASDMQNGWNFNRYNYAANNPYANKDPDGRACDSLSGGGCGMSTSGKMPSDPAAARAGVELVADFTPIVGDVKGVVEAIQDPSAVNVAAAGVGLVPVVGDAAARVIKGADKISDAGKAADQARGTIYVDSKGNAIVTPPGGKIEGSPDGRYVQAKDADGNATGVRIDGGHRPSTHPDPRAQQPHGHVPGVTNDDGTPWLPLKDK